MACVALLLSSCAGEFNKVYKSQDYDYRYEYAKQSFAEGKYGHAVTLLEDMVAVLKGHNGGDKAQESLYMLAMAQFMTRDYESASETFKKYTTSYPKGDYAEKAFYYVGESLFESAPEPRLDQSPTIGAINAYQTFLDNFPDSPYREEAQRKLFELQDKLIMKEYLSAKLYYKLREDFSLLIMKSKFQLAENSSNDKKLERYRDAEDECYGFINEFPDSEHKDLAERYIAKCKKITKD